MPKLILIGWLMLASFILFGTSFIYFEYFRDGDWIPSWKRNYDLQNEKVETSELSTADMILQGNVMFSYKRNEITWYRCRMKMKNGIIRTFDFLKTELVFQEVEINDKIINEKI